MFRTGLPFYKELYENKYLLSAGMVAFDLLRLLKVNEVYSQVVGLFIGHFMHDLYVKIYKHWTSKLANLQRQTYRNLRTYLWKQNNCKSV